MDKATEAALGSELAAAGGAAAQETTASTAALQQTLKLAGYWDGGRPDERRVAAEGHSGRLAGGPRRSVGLR